MNFDAARRRLERAGYDASFIEDKLDRLADEKRQEEKDRAFEELSRSLEADGYDLDQLERDNPYNQWMYQ